MANPIYFQNLKTLNERPNATGTTIGVKTCLDVNVLNSVAVPVSTAQYSFQEYRYHDASATNINASSGAFIQVATAADIANTITELRINWHGGEPIVISSGADATAAALAANYLAVVHAGESFQVGCSLASGAKIWVRALKNAAIITDELIINLLG